MGKQNVHVVPHEVGWAVKKEGNQKVSSLHSTQKDAIEAGKQSAKDLGSELVIHGRDGRIRDKDSYGNDPFPPRDKKH